MNNNNNNKRQKRIIETKRKCPAKMRKIVNIETIKQANLQDDDSYDMENLNILTFVLGILSKGSSREQGYVNMLLIKMFFCVFYFYFFL